MGWSNAIVPLVYLGGVNQENVLRFSGEINPIPGSNLPLATLGTFILWMGWFGFNGGSELKITDIGEANAVALVFVNTNAAAAAGVVGALITARLMFGKSDIAKRVDVLATAITAKMSVEDIAMLDLTYAPPVSPVHDPILVAANVANK